MSSKMTKIIRGLRAHAVLPLLIISVIIVVYLSLQVYDAQDDGSIEIVDLEGDKAALGDVIIEGYIRDSYHIMDFEWAQNSLTKATTIYDKPLRHAPSYARGGPLPNGEYDYEIYPAFYGGVGFEIRARHNREGYRTDVLGTALVQTSLQYRGDSDGYTFSNYQEKGLAFVGDRVFFVPPTTSDYTGESGIYEVLRFADRGSMQMPEEAETHPLVKLNMDGNSPKDGIGLEVLGLEAVGQHLALVAVVNGEIVIQVYDSNEGTLLGEVALDEPIVKLSGEAAVTSNGGYYQEYEASVDEDIGVLNLKFYSTESDEAESKLLVASISLGNEVKLLNKQELRYEGRDRALAGEMNLFSFRDGKLYAIMSTSVAPEMYTLFERLYDKQVLIEVYEAGVRLYRGELRTDVNDDLIEARYFASTHGTVDDSKYREIGGFRLRNAD
ncbi:hypothetical protein ACX1C1_11355 [Paenibacillus sp. strain BS8-2]